MVKVLLYLVAVALAGIAFTMPTHPPVVAFFPTHPPVVAFVMPHHPGTEVSVLG